MTTLSINASEIRSITTAEPGFKIPLMNAEESTARRQQVNLEGYEFPAITLNNPLSQDIEMIVNLTNGMIFELLPVSPESSDAETDAVRLNKIQLEETIKK